MAKLKDQRFKKLWNTVYDIFPQQSIDRQAEISFSKLLKWSIVHVIPNTQQNFSSSTFCDSTSSSASFSPDELVQQLELQIINQDVIQN